MSIPSTPSPLASILAAKTYNAAWFSGSTNEAKLTNAIAKAKADGALYVFTPSNFSGLNPALVTYDAAIQVYSEDDLAKAGIVSAGAYSSTVLANAFAGATNEAKITAAIAFAVAHGFKYVLVPQSMLPYNANLVTFNTSVRMLAEGANNSTLHGLAYGMDVTGGADIGPSLQAMVNYATKNDPLGPGGPELELPSGILAWNTLVTAYTANQFRLGAIKLRGQGGHATILRPTIAPAMIVGGTVGSVTDGFTASDFNVELTTQLYWGDGIFHLRLCRLWHFARIELVSGTNPVNDLYTYTGYLFNLDSSYNGVMEKCTANGKGVYLFEFNDLVDPSQQCDSVTFINCISTGMALGLIHAPTGATDDHNLVFYTPKYLMINTWPEANVSVETTLTSSPAVGANTFTLTSAAGLAIGNYIWVGIGANLELALISNLVGTTVTIANILKYAHIATEPVLMGGFAVSTAPKCHNLWLDHPHLEFCAMGIYDGGSLNTRVSDAYGIVKEIIRHAAGTTYGMRVERGEWHWGGAGVQCAIRVTAAGDSVNNGTFFMYGPFNDPNTGNPPATIFQNDAATNRSYRIYENGTLNTPGNVINQGTLSSAVLLESVTIGGGTVYERDYNGTQYSKRVTSARPALADGATVAVDASAGNEFQWSVAGAARTVLAPTNPPANGRTQYLTIWELNNTAGAIVTTWTGGGGGFKLAGAWVDPAAGKWRSITFAWEWSGNFWLEINRSAADA